jgi:hypothetical protein
LNGRPTARRSGRESTLRMRGLVPY